MNESTPDTTMPLAGGTITITVEGWANNGKGKWRSRKERVTFEQYDLLPCPGMMMMEIVWGLRKKVSELN